MATGVVSLCFHTTGPQWLSRSLFAVAAVVWAVLMAVVIGRVFTDRPRWADEAGAASSLTLAAGTAVLGSRLAAAGRTGLAAGLLAAGTLLWAVFLPPVLRRRPAPAVGTNLLVCVVPQALAVLAARLARMTSQRWELYAAATAFALGMVAYGMTVRRFDLRQILTGAGDQWVLAGALAISALAGAELGWSALVLGSPAETRSTLHAFTLVVAAAAAVTYVPLVAGEAIRPRTRFDMRRWSTVFPIGMAGLTGLQLASVFHEGPLHQTGRALSWLAFAVWALVAAASLAYLRTLLRKGRLLVENTPSTST